MYPKTSTPGSTPGSTHGRTPGSTPGRTPGSTPRQSRTMKTINRKKICDHLPNGLSALESQLRLIKGNCKRSNGELDLTRLGQDLKDKLRRNGGINSATFNRVIAEELNTAKLAFAERQKLNVKDEAKKIVDKVIKEAENDPGSFSYKLSIDDIPTLRDMFLMKKGRIALVNEFKTRNDLDKDIRLHLQADVHGGDPRFPLELMFGVPGQLNAELAGDGYYNDAAMRRLISDYLSDYDRQYFSGGTARMAKSKRMGRTRKGKGRKESKDGKKTRRLRCWSRRNKEAQRYVVCSGSRGQKTVRNTNKELEKAFKDLARLGVKPPFKNLKRTKSNKPEGQLSLEWRKANPVKIDKM